MDPAVHEQGGGLMAARSHYFRIGLFLLLGLGLIAGAAIFLGLGLVIRETRSAESYFGYSVEGLNSGSYVMYRGVIIGTVTSIGLVNDDYPEAEGEMERFVLVRMNLIESRIRAFAGKVEGSSFADEITRGMRVTVSVQMLTGEASLQLDYYDPERHPVPPITWEPDSLYIPAAPSTISRVEAILTRFADTLDDVDFQQLSQSINALSASLAAADIEGLVRRIGDTVEEARIMVRSLNDIVAHPDAKRLVPRAAELLETLEAAAVNLRDASAVMADVMTDPGVRQGLNRTPEILDNIHRAAAEISRGAEILAGTASTLGELTAAQRQRIDSLLENLTRAAENFEALSEEARRNPSGLLLGEPPPRSPIDRRR
jgi:ABC-type transporter Mla subunit MlaD